MARSPWGQGLAALVLAGASVAGGAVLHADSYRLRRRTVQLPGSFADGASLRILHISDFHALARHRKKLAFIRSLADHAPDLVIATGDFISAPDAIDPVLAALDPLLDIPGFFVFGSNDYYAPVPKNPFTYLFGSSTLAKERVPLPSAELASRLRARGWVNLNNARASVLAGGVTVHAIGVDDPHIERDVYPILAETRHSKVSDDGGLTIGVTHAPYTRILDALHNDDCSIIFAGHTHGGQVCLPGNRALVTNCDLPPRLASGMFAWPDTGKQPLKGDGALPPSSTIVQISAGMGTSPYAPVRTFCPPEAILVEVRGSAHNNGFSANL